MAWAGIARAQGGVIGRRQLLASGLSRSAITRLTSSEAIVLHARGVFLVRGAPLTYLARLWIAVLGTDGIVGYGTAAHLWGCVDRPAAIDIMIREGRRLEAPPGVRLHRTLLANTPVGFRHGLPVAHRSWALLDHLGELTFDEALRLADRALQRNWLQRTAFERRVLTHPYRHGNSSLRRLHEHTSDRAAAKSERLLHDILRRAGITGWQANYAVWQAGELVAVLDVALPELRVAIEVDGMAYHVDVDRFQRDRTRQNALVALGWTVVRFTWADLRERPGYVIAAVRRAAA